MEKIFLLIMCHMVGDYVFQSEFIAQMKGKNNYILFIHCVLYALPFYLIFGFSWIIIVIIATHFIIDIMKAKYNKINIVIDQLLHYCLLLLYYI